VWLIHLNFYIRNRLDKEMNDTMAGPESTGICKEGEKEEIKGKLKELCRTGKSFTVFQTLCFE